jgi:hypothetical protein
MLRPQLQNTVHSQSDANMRTTADFVTARAAVTNNVNFTAGSASNGVGVKKLTTVKPWESTVCTANPDTSYGMVYSNDFGETSRAKAIEKRLSHASPHGFGS